MRESDQIFKIRFKSFRDHNAALRAKEHGSNPFLPESGDISIYCIPGRCNECKRNNVWVINGICQDCSIKGVISNE